MPRDRNRNFRSRKSAKKGHIIVSHVTIRQSISILLIKLVILELIFAIIFLISRPVIVSSQLTDIFSYFNSYNIMFFLTAVLIKIILTVYIVLAWLNEYFEITPTLVRHKRGIFFVKKEQLALVDIQSITLHQGFIGKLLNFGTLGLYDWKWKKHKYLYAIHHPTKYLEIIEALLPNIDQERDIFVHEHIIKKTKEKNEIEGGENNGQESRMDT